jgi:hypothetical protein
MSSPGPAPGLHAVREVCVDLDARLTVTQAAALARVSKQLVNQWRRIGRLTALHEDGRWTYRAGDVLEVERDMRRSPHSTRAA